ncbi:MAG: type II toxin-antitoxin system VapC family toxin [Acidobacteria bacterium]|nr:type II toxin-antitoxin system VapC family toxin [Acidobacteriota bacterium]MBI1984382.1 type II toxin-antitoxin system VapC family toxin [Acidobacteriota bacterium]
MVLIDVNVLVYAHRAESVNHELYRRWLEACVESDGAYGITDFVLSGFVRIVTHPKIFKVPTPLEEALHVVTKLRSQPNCVLVSPGPRHWEIFIRLCRSAGVKGNLVSDAFLAAMAIESGSEWITADRDYSRFPGLRWRHPLDG